MCRVVCAYRGVCVCVVGGWEGVSLVWKLRCVCVCVVGGWEVVSLAWKLRCVCVCVCVCASAHSGRAHGTPAGM